MNYYVVKGIEVSREQEKHQIWSDQTKVDLPSDGNTALGAHHHRTGIHAFGMLGLMGGHSVAADLSGLRPREDKGY